MSSLNDRNADLNITASLNMSSAGWSLLASSDNNMSVQGTISAAERSIRSVFVGNIPYEATEEQLKDIFSEVGPVVSFRLVYDRETGKPKGYGFCEYKDQETALSAMRNLNGYELNGRSLRVDNAASEKNKEELKNLQAALGGPPQESPYGAECDPDKAPEAISKAVASLPPEQMFELMKQMKLCIQNNPNEARNMLLQNPQLAYALLQAQVVMRIVDPQIAMNMLHRSNVNTTISEAANLTPASTAPVNNQTINVVPPSTVGEPAFVPNAAGNVRGVRPALLGDRPPTTMEAPRPPPPPAVTTPFPDTLGAARDFDMRDPRSMGDRDMRAMAAGSIPRDPRVDNRDIREPRDPRVQTVPEPERSGFDPRFRGEAHPPVDNRVPMYDNRPPPGFDQRNASPYDQRSPMYEQRDPRLQPPQHPPNVPGPQPGMRPQQMGGIPRANPINMPTTPAPSAPAVRTSAPPAAQSQISPQDQEKAALIMQVLQLSEQQIAMLPPEQRQSIMVLKDQIARSTQPQ